MFRLDSVELVLIIAILVLTLVLDLQINVLCKVDSHQKTIFVSLILLFTSLSGVNLYKAIGEPRVFFTNLALNSLRERKERIYAKTVLNASILPSLALALYMVSLELSVGIRGKSILMMLQPALSVLLACLFYSIIFVTATAISKSMILSGTITGLSATIIAYFDTCLINQIILIEKIDMQILLMNSIIIGILVFSSLIAATRR